MEQWQEIGQELGIKIKDLSSIKTIKSHCLSALNQVVDTCEKATERKKAVTIIRSELMTVLGTSSKPFNTAITEITVEKATELSKQKTATNSIKIQTKPENWSIKNMKLKQLDLDAETQAIVEAAVEQTGMNLAEFVQKACTTYAKTVTGKVRKHGGDLTNVATQDLLENSTFATHPGRAEEVIKRAIRAIKKYNNDIATEPKERWIITQSLLTELTGSRASSVKETMQKCQDDIDSHHQKYPDFFNEDETLKTYFNRKKTKVTEVINLIELVPSGFDE